VPAGVMAGHIATKVNPVYPPEAKKAHVEGAVNAVTQWTYQPYLLNGEPVSVDTSITVNFQLGPPPAPLLPGRVRVSSGVMAGQKIKGSMPVIPPEAREQHVSGAVVTHVLIGKDGKVIEVTPISGPEMLRPSYVDAIRTWEYRPFLLNGEPVEVDTTITINFNSGG
jgi:outer membrane biosynthesis protein TonB